ncbi:hypothetical protein AG1IA_00972 [Rhizoctonia solani AG-1 IA]|uniref:Uncharacterized protein n=1 Tax=Thanatephorus cucumeris (strain AG1-IA) TaxID=983506 RepID=L8X3V6_THACA|nr:hypothetical protein AG1IA_00972 [Rhizoctonia solani AG-1 IA]
MIQIRLSGDFSIRNPYPHARANMAEYSCRRGRGSLTWGQTYCVRLTSYFEAMERNC